MEVAEGFLISTDEEDADVVGFAGDERVEREDVLDVFAVDEAVDFSIAVAGDVGEDGAVAWFFVEAWP